MNTEILYDGTQHVPCFVLNPQSTLDLLQRSEHPNGNNKGNRQNKIVVVRTWNEGCGKFKLNTTHHLPTTKHKISILTLIKIFLMVFFFGIFVF